MADSDDALGKLSAVLNTDAVGKLDAISGALETVVGALKNVTSAGNEAGKAASDSLQQMAQGAVKVAESQSSLTTAMTQTASVTSEATSAFAVMLQQNKDFLAAQDAKQQAYLREQDTLQKLADAATLKQAEDIRSVTSSQFILKGMQEIYSNREAIIAQLGTEMSAEQQRVAVAQTEIAAYETLTQVQSKLRAEFDQSLRPGQDLIQTMQSLLDTGVSVKDITLVYGKQIETLTEQYQKNQQALDPLVVSLNEYMELQKNSTSAPPVISRPGADSSWVSDIKDLLPVAEELGRAVEYDAEAVRQYTASAGDGAKATSQMSENMKAATKEFYGILDPGAKLEHTLALLAAHGDDQGKIWAAYGKQIQSMAQKYREVDEALPKYTTSMLEYGKSHVSTEQRVHQLANTVEAFVQNPLQASGAMLKSVIMDLGAWGIAAIGAAAAIAIVAKGTTCASVGKYCRGFCTKSIAGIGRNVEIRNYGFGRLGDRCSRGSRRNRNCRKGGVRRSK